MKHIMQELYYGEINPSDHRTPPMYTMQRFRAEYERCYRVLPAENIEELESAVEKMVISLSRDCESMFETGFTLGCRLMLEVMDHDWT